MSDERITRVSGHDRIKGRTDFARLEKLSDDVIADAVAGDADAAALDVDWAKAEVVVPARKVPISIRLDEDVLAFFRDAGAGYQGRINAVLRSYVEAKHRAGFKKR